MVRLTDHVYLAALPLRCSFDASVYDLFRRIRYRKAVGHVANHIKFDIKVNGASSIICNVVKSYFLELPALNWKEGMRVLRKK